mmetsp:Transcript_52573/g.137935  ORF Transcript_52573/g.137935 Transcript_52573/m.137935 type:complete len:323 (-) Transcript_52573:45-1013(-)
MVVVSDFIQVLGARPSFVSLGRLGRRLLLRRRRRRGLGRRLRVELLPPLQVGLQLRHDVLVHGRQQVREHLVVGQHDEPDEADLRCREYGAVPRAHRRHRQPFRLLPVTLHEELLQHRLGPAVRDGEGPAGVGQVRGVQDVEAQLVQRRRVRLPIGGVLAVGADEQLEALHALEVALHVRAQDHVDNEPARLAGLGLGQVGEDVDGGVPRHARQHRGEVVVLLHALVVEGQGALGGGVLVVAVVQTVVPGVVQHGRHQHRHDLRNPRWSLGRSLSLPLALMAEAASQPTARSCVHRSSLRFPLLVVHPDHYSHHACLSSQGA